MPNDPNSAVAARKSRLQRPAGRVRDGGGDVRAEQLGRDQLAGPPLDLLTRDGVGHVGGPEPLHLLGDAEVDPAAARGARLPGHVGVRAAQRVEQPVVGQRLGARDGRAADGSGAGLEQVAVVVPLHEVDRVRRQHGVHPLEDVLPGLGPGQVQHLLVALGQRHPVAGGEHPVGVRAVEVGVGVDHLGLEPEAELHAQTAHVLDERAEPALVGRPHRLVDPPVARGPPSRRDGGGTTRRRARTARRRPARPARRCP